MNPCQTSQRTPFRPYWSLSRLKNSLSCWTKISSPSSPYRQAWYLQVKVRQVPDTSSAG